MEKFVASGELDLFPGGAIDPETDDATYDGSVWLLARQTYWRDPASPVIANHFLSAIDAYVSVRTSLRREPNGATTAAASVPIRY